MYLVKYLRNGQNNSHGISPTPSTMLFDDPPYPNDIPKFHLICIKTCVKDVEMIT